MYQALVETLLQLQRADTKIAITTQSARTWEGYVVRVSSETVTLQIAQGRYRAMTLSHVVAVRTVSVPRNLVNPSCGMTEEVTLYDASDLAAAIRSALYGHETANSTY